MPEWCPFSPATLYWLAGSSLFVFLASVIVVPWLIIRMPADFFRSKRRRRPHWAMRHPLLRFLIQTGRNVLGALFIVAGLALLALPGQGMLTIMAGIFISAFPGKHRLERWLVSRPALKASLNWLRQRAGREPLTFDP